MKFKNAFEELLDGVNLTVPPDQLVTDLDEIIINADNIDFETMTNLTYLHCKHFDIHGEYKISKLLITKMKRGKYAKLFSKMKKYDPVTYMHSIRVGYLATALGLELGYDRKDLELLAEGSLIHDAGKILIPSHILKKEDSLTREEFMIMMNHPEYGIDVLEWLNIHVKKEVMDIVVHHHERFDGEGYPSGLKDFNISKNARIVHIVDVYDALCTSRPYKKELDRHAVWILMDGGIETDFDPVIYQKFKKIMPKYLLGERITHNGKTASVIGINKYDMWNPLMYCNGSMQFYNEMFK